MPVQDNDDNRKKTPAPVPDDEKPKQQAQENNIQKSGKLLPFLNVKAEQHTSRIDNLNGKIATQESKTAKHTAKIEKLTVKADKLEDTNRMLKNMLGDFPPVKALIAKNEQKIADIRENKIPNRQQKIKTCKSKVDKLTQKRDMVQHKLNRVIALNDTIKSFTIGKNAERRAAFSNALDRLNTATIDCLSDKKSQLESRKNAVMKQYNDPKTDVADKFKLQDKLNDLTAKITAVDEKIAKIKPDIRIAEKPPELVDATIKLTSDKVAENVQDGKVSIPEISLDTVTAAQSVETLDKSKINELVGHNSDNPLKSAEEMLEDDANMIDGIINNGSKSDLEQQKAELLAQLAAIDNALGEKSAPQQTVEVTSENWLENAVSKGIAEMSDNGGFKVNPDYYAELPKDERHFESMNETQAVEVMAALSAAEIAFSAASRGDGKVSLTVAKNDVSALNDIMYSAIGKIAKTAAAKENGDKGEKGKYQTVNPEYYASLAKNQRFTQVEPIDTGRKIAAELQKANIPFSAVVRKNDTVALTVSKANEQTFRQIEGKHRKPKQVEKRADKAYFSRSKLKRDAQSISGKSSQKEPQKSKGQEIF